MVNCVVLVGRITRDLELRRANSGLSVVSFTLAFNNRTKNADGSQTSSFVNCSAFGKTAEVLCNYCSKGSQVAIQGHLQERKYQRKDGTNASVVEIMVDNLELVGARQGGSTSVEKSVGYQNDIVSNNSSEEKNDDLSDDLAEDDLPF